MLSDWKNCKNILCIRPDNMGDLLMTGPAIRALKESFGAKITVLTSSMAAGIARMMPEIDEVMVFDLPWIKAAHTVSAELLSGIVADIRSKQFDAAVIFTVYSQNPLPTAMLAYLAGIPRTLAYCRENPYELLTNWIPDPEPYSTIRHQVRRDLDLVAYTGAKSADNALFVSVKEQGWELLKSKLLLNGINLSSRWLILHPGVSEKKREYPEEAWIETGRLLAADYQLLITGGPAEKELTGRIAAGIGQNAHSLAGILNLEEFVLLVKKAPLVISVNTGTVHIAAAVQTPVVVLYAMTNPQHFPWKVPGKVFTFSIPKDIKSRNEVIRYVDSQYLAEPLSSLLPDKVADTAFEILNGKSEMIPELPSPICTPVSV